MSEMIERVARAIDAVQLFSRFNDWTSDRVEGCPIEICRYGRDDEDEIVVVGRFGGAITEAEALSDTISKARARAAIEAMRDPTNDMLEAMHNAMFADKFTGGELPMLGAGFEAAVDAALAPPSEE